MLVRFSIDAGNRFPERRGVAWISQQMSLLKLISTYIGLKMIAWVGKVSLRGTRHCLVH